MHLDVCGVTGSGKSVFLRGLITQLLVTAPEICIVGIDFKGGAVFAFLDKLGRNFLMATEHDTAAAILARVFDEYQRRAAMLAQSEFESVYQIAGVVPIVVVIDESAEFFDKSLAVNWLNPRR